MISHLTSSPAKRLSLYPSRGKIAVGSFADIVLFDPKTIKDEATFEMPKKLSEGIRWVLVNGVVVLEEGKMNGKRAGRVLRWNRDRVRK